MFNEKILLFVYVVVSSTQCMPFPNPFRDTNVTTDPDTYLSPLKIIRRYGYTAEAHIVQSEDGYLLEYHRIPRGKDMSTATKPYPILIHHGLLCSSFDWIMNGPKRSIGYRFADEGYDVWLGNARGNTYSRSHVSLSPKDKKFWNFTFHEMGIYDLAAAIDYILTVTNSSKLIYIGHSQGTTMFYTLMSSKPEYNAKVIFHVGIAPVAMLGHTTSSFRMLIPFAKEIKSMSDWYNKGAFLEHDVVSSLICKILCGPSVFDFNICEQLIIFKLAGKDAEQFNKSMMPLITAHAPAGTSAKNMIHSSQLISSSQFLHYDYGVKENMQRYGSSTPPAYDLSKISVPIKFYYGENDILADPLDVKLLYQQLPKPLGCKAIDYPKWNHVDFVWAIDINKYFNDDLIEFVNNCTKTTYFIGDQVAKSLRERLLQPVPVDRPFDVDRFMQNKFNGIPTLGNVTQLTMEFEQQQNVIQDYTFKIKEHVQQNIDKAKNDLTEHVDKVQKVFNETMHKTGRSISETAQNVQLTIVSNISNAKKSFEKSITDIDTKIKDLINKLGQRFDN